MIYEFIYRVKKKKMLLNITSIYGNNIIKHSCKSNFTLYFNFF